MSKKAGIPLVIGLWALALVSLILALSLGSVPIPPFETVSVIFNRILGRAPAGDSVLFNSIILSLRIPRALTAGITGAALSVAGAAMQGLLKNPLADGATLGTASGASLGSVLFLTVFLPIGVPGFITLPLSAAVFAFLSLALVVWISRGISKGLSSNVIILTGVIFSMFAASMSALLISLSRENVDRIIFWSMGSFAASGYGEVLLLFCVCLPCIALLIFCQRELDALSFGEEAAGYIGVNVSRTRYLVLICASALVGVTTSVCGVIGFVGLVVPHLVRRITGPRHKLLFAACIPAGAAFLILTDLLARSLIRPLELPVGVLTSICGALLFVSIFYKSRAREGYDG